MPDPWQCPQCFTWIAPTVTEHRCDPAAGAPATLAPPPPPGGPTGVTTRMAGTVITLHTTTRLDGATVARALQRQTLAAANCSTSWRVA